LLSRVRPLLQAILIGSVIAGGQAASAVAQESPSVPVSPPADATLTASPSVLGVAVKPGGRQVSTITLHAGVALDVSIASQGLGQSPADGGFTYLPPGEDTGQYSARPLVDVSPSTFSMTAGEVREASLTVSAPASVGDGERFALLKVTGQPKASSGNVGFSVALGVSVVVSLLGTTVQRTGAVEGLSVGAPATRGDPVTVTGTLRNTGNIHYGAPPNQLTESATLRDGTGAVLGSTATTIVGNSIVPGFARQFKLSIQPTAPLAGGHYAVEVGATLQDGTVLDRETVQVDLGAGLPVVTPPSSDGLPLVIAGLLSLLAALLLIVFVSRRRQVAAPVAAMAPVAGSAGPDAMAATGSPTPAWLVRAAVRSRTGVAPARPFTTDRDPLDPADPGEMPE